MMHRANIKSLIVAILLVIAVAPVVRAEQEVESYKFDFGAGVGMSGYLGDVNTSNVFHNPGVAANVSFRYLIDNRWAIRGLLSAESLSGNSADFENIFPENQSYSFKSWIYDLGARVEFNFFNYGIGETYKRLRRWTPYLSVGVGVTLSSADGSMFVAPTVPMSIGVKYKLKQRLNLGLEMTMTKAFGDHLDGKDLSDLYGIKSSFLKNTDWFSTLTLSISYEFGPRCVVCHRID
ncbi:MAG: outer membrane beta-barrel protein [Muribaculaceae bacterium]|nr:outer membrane beta-barrel protein [Muribaculaceae bacterium]